MRSETRGLGDLIFISTIICGALLLTSRAQCDSVQLKNGSILEGKIVEEDDANLTINVDGANIKVPKSALENRAQELDGDYHRRMARQAFDDKQFDQATLHLKKYAEINNHPLIPVALEEIEAAKKYYAEHGEEGYAEFIAHTSLIREIVTLERDGKFREALASLKKFYDNAHSQQQQVSPALALFAANLTVKCLVLKFQMTPEQHTELNARANAFKGPLAIQFAASPEDEAGFTVLTSAEDIWLPLEKTKKMPMTFLGLRKLYQDNFEVDLLLVIASVMNKLELPKDLVIEEPMLRQWYWMVKLVNQQEKSYYDSKKTMADAEAQQILNDLQKEWEANRDRAIQEIIVNIRNMVQAGTWGYELRDEIRRLERLNPVQEISNEIATYDSRNEEQILTIQSQQRAINRVQNKKTSYWDGFTEGEAIVGKIGSKKVMDH